MKKQDEKKRALYQFPACAEEYIKLIVKKMRYRRKVQQDVQAELAAHFEDELKDCATGEEREQKAKRLIAGFGDVKLLAVLLRRAKKRCRPLWQKALVRSAQVLGIIFLYLLICLSPMIVGRPTISVNYVDWLNEAVRAGRDEADNARPYYEKAAQLYVMMPDGLTTRSADWSADLNDVELDLLPNWLDDNKQAIDAIRQGSACPGYWSKYQGDETKLSEGLVANAMEILPSYRRLAFALQWQIRYEVYNGDIDKAFSDCVAMVKFGCHLHSNGLLIEQLVGIALEALAHNTIFTLLERNDTPADVLKSTQQELDKLFNTQEPIISMEAEKVFWYDQIQRSFTDDGKGSGRLLVRGLAYVVTDDWMDNLWRFVSFNYPDRKETLETIERYFKGFDEFVGQTPLDLRDKDIDEQQWDQDDNIAPKMLKHLTDAHKRVSQIAWRTKTGRRALLTVLAALRYEKENGRYPDSPNELVKAGYLQKIPIDPYSDSPLVYRRTEDGFLLYSFGSNLMDDGGILGLGENGKPRMWADNGDWVFWPTSED